MSRHELVLIKDEDRDETTPTLAQYLYGDWFVRWVGWSEYREAGLPPIGQHLAWNSNTPKDHYLYTSYPGGGGWVVKGELLDVEQRDYQTDWTKFEGLARQRAEGWAKSEALDRLIALIDEAEEKETEHAQGK